MCSLLDRIEMVAEDESQVRVLCRGRFEMARDHGLEVRLTDEASGADH